MTLTPQIQRFQTAGSAVDLSSAPAVMGILNVTPDSFSDGGKFTTAGAALTHAARMLEEGAAIIEVGAESTRPGSSPVPSGEQIRRAVPVLAAIRGRFPQAVISIDTRSAEVAAAALDAGADIINDISALRDDPAMARLAAERRAGVVLMHMQGEPATMQQAPRYEDVVSEVRDFLVDRARTARTAGIESGRIVLDPGIGFGKTTEHNLALMRGLDRVVELGYPVLVGGSRKRSVRSFTGDDSQSLLAGSLAWALAAALAGARLVRAHDVGPTVQWLRAAGSAIRPPNPHPSRVDPVPE